MGTRFCLEMWKKGLQCTCKPGTCLATFTPYIKVIDLGDGKGRRMIATRNIMRGQTIDSFGNAKYVMPGHAAHEFVERDFARDDREYPYSGTTETQRGLAFVVPREDINRLSPEAQNQIRTCWRSARKGRGHLVNNACKGANAYFALWIPKQPNGRYNQTMKTYVVMAARDIKEGEEITVKYYKDPPGVLKWCKCAACEKLANQRALIRKRPVRGCRKCK